jgi:hypothetical protein
VGAAALDEVPAAAGVLALAAVDELLVELVVAAVALAVVLAVLGEAVAALLEADVEAAAATTPLPGGPDVVPTPGLGSFAAKAAMSDCQGAGKPVVERVGGWPGYSW